MKQLIKLLGNLAVTTYNSGPGPGAMRIQAKLDETAEARDRIAKEIVEHNSKVVRRNQRFVRRKAAQRKAA